MDENILLTDILDRLKKIETSQTDILDMQRARDAQHLEGIHALNTQLMGFNSQMLILKRRLDKVQPQVSHLSAKYHAMIWMAFGMSTVALFFNVPEKIKALLRSIPP